LCNALSPDSAETCQNCLADLHKYSITAVALKKFLDNPRVTQVLLATYDDSCPACRAVQGSYEKDNLPKLPVNGCSNPKGCRCHYQPVLSEIYP
jgi:hypothetical protein